MAMASTTSHQFQGSVQSKQEQPEAFSAAPLLVNRPGPNNAGFGHYKDPYRELVKLAPQNLMYDRRVVRGNTFAALVIPVNIQPDPAVGDKKQKMGKAPLHSGFQKKQRPQSMFQKQRLMSGFQKTRQPFQQQQQHQMADQTTAADRMSHGDMNQQQQDMYKTAHCWEELSDFDNMVEEENIEPDYFIDRAPQAHYVPDHPGHEKANQVNDMDPELFDYELEVEPILQVLVGKSLEQARIEVIEQYEQQEAKKALDVFYQIKEAELMETQRLQAAANRKVDEIDRRSLEQRTQRATQMFGQKRIIARNMAKDFLIHLKKNTLEIMVDEGTLRKRQDFSFHHTYMPQLYNQVLLNMANQEQTQDHFTEIVFESTKVQSKLHKMAILKEFKRREEKEKERLRLEKAQQEAKRLRKEQRNALREQVRIMKLQDILTNEVLPAAQLEEYTKRMPIFDVRDYNQTQQGIYLIGGFIGELIITLTCLQDYILANPQNTNFQFRQEELDAFLVDLLANNEYPEEICFLPLVEDLGTDKEGNPVPVSEIQLLKQMLEPLNIASFGLQFLLESQKDFILSVEVIQGIFKSIIKNSKLTFQELLPVPEPLDILQDSNMTEEERLQQEQMDQEEIDEINNKNNEIALKNAEIEKTISKIGITYPGPLNYSEIDEKCLLKLNNYREPKPEESENNNPLTPQKTLTISSSKDDGLKATSSNENLAIINDEVFEYDKIPNKVVLVQPQNTQLSLTMLVHHSEACYAVRKPIIEVARRHWKELEKVNMNSLLGYTSQKSKQIEARFEEHCIKTIGFGLGQQFTDRSVRITYNTFLQA